MRYYVKNAPAILYKSPIIQMLMVGLCLLLAGTLILGAGIALLDTPLGSESNAEMLNNFSVGVIGFGATLMCSAVLATFIALAMRLVSNRADLLRWRVFTGLYQPSRGNPLHLIDGELLPALKCKEKLTGLYELQVLTDSSTVEDVMKLASAISSRLTGQFSNCAVTQVLTDVAYNGVSFIIEDVTVHRELTASSVEQLKPSSTQRLMVQQGFELFLPTSGSIIAAGKTRSGKTTGVIALLLQVLLLGRDKFSSEVLIVDPKQAELSRLPHVISLDEDGEARGILAALEGFTAAIKQRQAVLNDLSEQKGDAVKWWDAGMHPSFLFLDEYVALRSLFPKRAVKDDGGYNLAAFDGLIKRIVTMGASAGCYAIISIAEASVEEGGLPAMLRSACGTKVLFKPTLPEARLLWDGEKLEAMPQGRLYGAGDAWLSSTDGEHDIPSFVHFPVMDFPVYAELGRLLAEYYENA